jgi:hypothetical protein
VKKALAACLVALSMPLAASAWGGPLLQLEGRLLKWQPQPPASGTVITYFILDAPYMVPGNKSILSPSNCAGMHAFSDIVAQSPTVTPAMAEAELKAAFAAWEEVANIAFVRAADPSAADIIVGAQDIPEGRAFANLSYRRDGNARSAGRALAGLEPPAAIPASDAERKVTGAEIDQAYVCLNPKIRWKTGFDGNLDIYDLRYTFTHEVGHAIGLDHPDDMDALMSYRYDEHVQALMPPDIAAVQRLYGPPTQKRESAAAAATVLKP